MKHLIVVICLLSATPAFARDYSRSSASWYIGFGFGPGGARASVDGDSATNSGGSLLFKLGGVVNEHFLLGVDVSCWRTISGSAVQFNHYDVVGTIFPVGGLYIKLGGGVGNLVLDNSDGLYYSQAFPDLKLGIGYEFQVGESFNFGLELQSATMFAHDDYWEERITLSDGSLLLTFQWY